MSEFGPVDGRVARRERNIQQVLDVVLEMFGEESLFPTIEQAAKRSGLSARSLYRYFADQGEMVDAAIELNRRRGEGLARLPAIGQGPLARRVDDFAAMRVRLYERLGAVYQATLHHAPQNPTVRDRLLETRQELRRQFETQFAPELAARKGPGRDAVLAAGDVLSQLDSIGLLRRYRQLSVAEATDVLRSGLMALLAPDRPDQGAP